ncbi:FadD3 family acyl-CoA ligase [Pseudonocardia ailaonensis]|uniref:FadD3 family acyl-CoA ligase n=1 Tax=Pseudonocardia ailaonensis TaxID=367279 RepID=A0ABN2MYB6_9PSEU
MTAGREAGAGAGALLDEPSEHDCLPGALRRAAALHPSVEAVVDSEHRLDYRALLVEVERVAAALLSRGVRPGDRVAVWAPNSVRWALAALGVVHIGATLVPVNSRYRGEEAQGILARSGAVALFVEDGFLGTGYLSMLDGAEPLPLLHTRVSFTPTDLGLSWESFLDGSATTDRTAVEGASRAVGPDTLLQIMFTSGSTGKPKGVLQRHGQMVRTIATYTAGLRLRAGDRYLLVNPFFHGFGLNAGLYACIIRGATALAVRRFDAGEALDLIERERVTGIPGPPTLYSSLLDHPARADRDISTLRLAVTGASVIPSQLIRRMRDELGFRDIVTAYGLTEACGFATMCSPDDPDEVVEHTSGRAMPRVEVTIAAVDGSEHGEILVRGENIMFGYTDDPVATAKAVDAEGRLHTGDLGYLDADGNLHITGRMGDMFIVGGFNVAPAEVEEVLCRHPAVSEAAVIGVPDDRMGESGQAFVVLRHRAEALGPDDLVAWCCTRLANFKVPRTVAVVPELPRADTGKVDKAALRRRATT